MKVCYWQFRYLNLPNYNDAFSAKFAFGTGRHLATIFVTFSLVNNRKKKINEK